MPDTRIDSLCCGGEAGFDDLQRSERFSDIRIEQAVDAGAEMLATACLIVLRCSRIAGYLWQITTRLRTSQKYSVI
jgi:hypothetical protein